MSSNKTLVILSPAFPRNAEETYWVPSQQLMVKALQRNFPQLRIIVLALLYPYESSEYTWNGIEVISFNGNSKRKLSRPLLWLSVRRKLKAIHHATSITGIISFWCGECAFIGNQFAKRYSIRHISWICGQDARKTNKWVRFIKPKANELVAMSSFLANEFFKNHKIKPAHVVANAIDPSTFPAVDTNSKDVDILGVGSFEPLKQYDVFINIIHSLKQSIPYIQALHCGIGKEKNKIEELITQLSLGKNVQLLGGKPHADIIRLMQRTKVFLHPSEYEGFSTVCLEALYAGAHVISFCYPLDHPVEHWHVVHSEKEMVAKALAILQNAKTDYSPIFLHSMDDSAKEIMQLIEPDTAKKENKHGDYVNTSHGQAYK
jgi:glycosyltransferase involved in cell wall biosynthesis